MNQGKNKIIIATRGSKLALWQANWIKGELENRQRDIHIELNIIKTTGDKILDVPLAKVGGKGLFVKEIEEAMLSRDADLAVHSMKDVPAVLPADLHIGAICNREDPRDAFLSKFPNFKSLPQGATVGTSSLRRMCQLLHERPDLKIVQLRGNLDTRIRKLDEGQFDAIIVAAAGVKRLAMSERITEILSTVISIPAIGQGAVGIECRVHDELTNQLISPLNHPETAVCVRAERAFNKKLEGGCQVPLAAHAQLVRKPESAAVQEDKSDCELSTDNCELRIAGLVGSINGNRIIRGFVSGKPDDAERLGVQLAEDLLSRGAGEILDEIYNQ
jgi:hydroxymethylbilane synthase